MGTIYFCTKFYLNVESSFKVFCQTRYRTDAKYAFPFYQKVYFYFVRCTVLINIFGSKSRTLTQQNSRLFVSTLYVNCLCNDMLLMHKTYRPNMFSVLLQLKDLISENMKISK